MNSSYQAGHIQGGYLGGSPTPQVGLKTTAAEAPAPQIEHPYSAAQDAHARMFHLLSRLESVRDRLAGSVPEKTGHNVLKEASPSDFLSRYQNQAQTAQIIAGNFDELVSAIERVI